MTFTVRHSYQYSSLKSKYKYEKYKEILELYFYEVSKAMIYDHLWYRIPYGGGTIFIIKYKPRVRKSMDYQHWKTTGEIRPHLNKHSNGYQFKFKWKKGYSTYYPNLKLYKFIVNRGNDYIIGARGLAKYIKECSKNPLVQDYDAL